MDNIILYNREKTIKIDLPRVRELTVGGEPVYQEKQMASGKMVRDILGFRVKISANWEWLPAETLKMVHELLRTGTYIYVEYPDPLNGKGSGMFSATYPDSKIFKFTPQEPRWYGVSITLKAQEVTR